ncbi:hypothetical protein N7532_003714 [Penicillium argentinense]|uniref:Secreted protein n=1 Tax=Penicillium argentinense TaxID=1131581 RepID=A0A9W9KE52_9EURO|nr:uncharacterized protein N7532_003714 [Penicillium argentinense]KAJ5103185.1 hypothetical protein N7532_003714 [Penicillium argentinense]
MSLQRKWLAVVTVALGSLCILNSTADSVFAESTPALHPFIRRRMTKSCLSSNAPKRLQPLDSHSIFGFWVWH